MNKILKWALYGVGGIAIAVAVLLFLSFFIGWPYNPFCCVVPEDDPVINASWKLADCVRLLGVAEKTSSFNWKPGAILSSSALANEIAGFSEKVSESQICILRGDFAADSRFDSEGQEGKFLRYVGTSHLGTKLLVLCDQANRIKETAKEGYEFTWAGQIDSCNFNGSEEKVCIVALVHS